MVLIGSLLSAFCFRLRLSCRSSLRILQQMALGFLSMRVLALFAIRHTRNWIICVSCLFTVFYRQKLVPGVTYSDTSGVTDVPPAAV